VALGKPAIVLTPDFKYALDLMEQSNSSIFVTGRAGTGKSTLLQSFRRTSAKRVVVLAPTGVSALNVGGQTIHSFFRFPARFLEEKDITRKRQKKTYKAIDVLVIDEISMVRADLLDAMDRVLRLTRNDSRPFGGVQVAMFGDLFQLPPVVASPEERHYFQTVYHSPYFFSARVMQEEFAIEFLELRKAFRQSSTYFLRMLDAVRTNQADSDVLTELNSRWLPNQKAEAYTITLTARNATADRINMSELEQLEGKGRAFQATVSGTVQTKVFPAELILTLKIGAQVMFVKNDSDGEFVNGTIGRVVGLKDEGLVVECEDGQGQRRQVEVGRMTWEMVQYKLNEEKSTLDTEVVGTFTQFPVKLAWAITIHKSQGQTFDRVIIDMGRGGAFEHGQTYVALSRCRTLEGILLKQPLRQNDILVDSTVVDQYEQWFR
jgi:ATP-dependent DNA helicase PIF1